MEVFAGVVDDEAEGVTADAGVKVRGMFAKTCCLKADGGADRDGRRCLAEPMAQAGEGDVAEGAMLGYETTK